MKEFATSLTDATIAVGVVVSIPLAALHRTSTAAIVLAAFCAAAALRFASQRGR